MTAFVDVEVVLVNALDSFGTVGTKTPANLQAVLAASGEFIRVLRRGGGDDHVSDYPRVDVDVFAPTRAAAWVLARAIHDHLRFGHAVPAIDRVETGTGPQQLPWDDEALCRVGMSYRITTRRT